MTTTEQNRMAQLVGSVITGVRDACRNGLLDWSPRLLLAMYSCDIQCSSTLESFPYWTYKLSLPQRTSLARSMVSSPNAADASLPKR